MIKLLPALLLVVLLSTCAQAFTNYPFTTNINPDVYSVVSELLQECKTRRQIFTANTNDLYCPVYNYTSHDVRKDETNGLTNYYYDVAYTGRLTNAVGPGAGSVIDALAAVDNALSTIYAGDHVLAVHDLDDWFSTPRQTNWLFCGGEKWIETGYPHYTDLPQANLGTWADLYATYPRPVWPSNYYASAVVWTQTVVSTGRCPGHYVGQYTVEELTDQVFTNEWRVYCCLPKLYDRSERATNVTIADYRYVPWPCAKNQFQPRYPKQFTVSGMTEEMDGLWELDGYEVVRFGGDDWFDFYSVATSVVYKSTNTDLLITFVGDAPDVDNWWSWWSPRFYSHLYMLQTLEDEFQTAWATYRPDPGASLPLNWTGQPGVITLPVAETNWYSEYAWMLTRREALCGPYGWPDVSQYEGLEICYTPGSTNSASQKSFGDDLVVGAVAFYSNTRTTMTLEIEALMTEGFTGEWAIAEAFTTTNSNHAREQRSRLASEPHPERVDGFYSDNASDTITVGSQPVDVYGFFSHYASDQGYYTWPTESALAARYELLSVATNIIADVGARVQYGEYAVGSTSIVVCPGTPFDAYGGLDGQWSATGLSTNSNDETTSLRYYFSYIHGSVNGYSYNTNEITYCVNVWNGDFRIARYSPLMRPSGIEDTNGATIDSAQFYQKRSSYTYYSPWVLSDSPYGACPAESSLPTDTVEYAYQDVVGGLFDKWPETHDEHMRHVSSSFTVEGSNIISTYVEDRHAHLPKLGRGMIRQDEDTYGWGTGPDSSGHGYLSASYVNDQLAGFYSISFGQVSTNDAP